MNDSLHVAVMVARLLRRFEPDLVHTVLISTETRGVITFSIQTRRDIEGYVKHVPEILVRGDAVGILPCVDLDGGWLFHCCLAPV